MTKIDLADLLDDTIFGRCDNCGDDAEMDIVRGSEGIKWDYSDNLILYADYTCCDCDKIHHYEDVYIPAHTSLEAVDDGAAATDEKRYADMVNKYGAVIYVCDTDGKGYTFRAYRAEHGDRAIGYELLYEDRDMYLYPPHVNDGVINGCETFKEWVIETEEDTYTFGEELTESVIKEIGDIITDWQKDKEFKDSEW